MPDLHDLRDALGTRHANDLERIRRAAETDGTLDHQHARALDAIVRFIRGTVQRGRVSATPEDEVHS